MSLQNENKEIFNQTKFIQTIIDHSNYILIGSLMVINVLISMVAWILFSTLILLENR